MTLRDGKRHRSLGDHLALRRQGVRGLARLGDQHAQRPRIRDGVAIPVLARVIDLDGKPRQTLDHVLAGQGRVPTGAACGDVDSVGGAELVVADLHLAEEDLAGFRRDSTQRGFADGPRLLEDLLEHEVLVAALFRLNRVPQDGFERALDGIAVEIGELDPFGRQDGDIAVGQEIELARVVQDSRHIRGDKVFAFPHADHDRGPVARGDDLVGLAGGDHADRVSAGQLAGRAAHRVLERHGLARLLRRAQLLLDQVGDDLRCRSR